MSMASHQTINLVLKKKNHVALWFNISISLETLCGSIGEKILVGLELLVAGDYEPPPFNLTPTAF